jgi:hypothetical protein
MRFVSQGNAESALLRAVPVNDREEHFVPPVRAVDIARPERGRWPRSPTVSQKEPLMATR